MYRRCHSFICGDRLPAHDPDPSAAEAAETTAEFTGRSVKYKRACEGSVRYVGLALVVIVVLGIAVVFILGSQVLGVGYFNQVVLLESTKPIEHVSYCCWTIDEATRRQAETTANENLFDWDRTCPVTSDQFTARIKFLSRSGFLSNKVSHPAHLIVLAEFTDGTRACRVVDVPRGLGKESVAVQFPLMRSHSPSASSS